MTNSYNAVGVIPVAPSENRRAGWLEALEGYSPVISPTDRQGSEVVISFPAESMAQAIKTGWALLHAATGYLEADSFRVLLSDEYDAEVERLATVQMPSLIGVTDAATMIGVSRQQVQRWIDGGQLRAVKAGSAYAVARYDAEQIAAARAAGKTVDG